MTLVVVAVLIVAVAAGAAVPLAVWWAERRRGPPRPVPPLIYPLVPPGHRDIEITPMVSRDIRPSANGRANGSGKVAPAAAPRPIADRVVESVIHLERPAFENRSGGELAGS